MTEMNIMDDFLARIAAMDPNSNTYHVMETWMHDVNMKEQDTDTKKTLARVLQTLPPHITISWYGVARADGWSFEDIDFCLPNVHFMSQSIVNHVVHNQSPHFTAWMDLYNQLAEKSPESYDQLSTHIMQSLLDVLCKMDVAGMARWNALMDQIQGIEAWTRAIAKAQPKTLEWDKWADRKVRLAGDSNIVKSIFQSHACAPMVRHLMGAHGSMRSTVYALAKMEDVVLSSLLDSENMVAEPLRAEQDVQKFKARGYFENWGKDLAQKWEAIVQNMSIQSRLNPSLWGRMVGALSSARKM